MTLRCLALLLLASACREHSGPAPQRPSDPPPAPPPHQPTPRATLPTSQPSAPERAVQFYAPMPWHTPADLDQPFDSGDEVEVRVTTGAPTRVVRSCRDILELPLTAAVETVAEDTPTYKAFWSIAVDCLAAQFVQSARPSRTSRLDDLLAALQPDHDPTTLLPPELGDDTYPDYAARMKQAAASCHSWKTVDASVHVTRRKQDELWVSAKDWEGLLSVYARADFDGDGFEDLLVRRNGGPREGSLVTFQLLVLTRTDADGCIRVAKTLI